MNIQELSLQAFDRRLFLSRSNLYLSAALYVGECAHGRSLAYAVARPVNVWLNKNSVWLDGASFALSPAEIEQVRALWPDLRVYGFDDRSTADNDVGGASHDKGLAATVPDAPCSAATPDTRDSQEKLRANTRVGVIPTCDLPVMTERMQGVDCYWREDGMHHAHAQPCDKAFADYCTVQR